MRTSFYAEPDEKESKIATKSNKQPLATGNHHSFTLTALNY
ncbi:hypothetical protein ACFSTE_00625 [Aquimarina hainanensis]|uniref:Uncharacterized protein n=1 Tax=Aquimarina hainanensis TaxID=1578017 RepID=A0ABW5N528_9FLAO|nr:hypothetical protein [Aquimarina sp. TRL1]